MAYSRWNQLGIRLQSEPRNFGASLLHLIRYHIPVDVERRLDVTVPHELLLHCDLSPHSVEPRPVNVPEAVCP